MEKFFEKLDLAIKNDILVKMTLSKPVSKNSELRNIYVKPILLKNNKMYQFTYRYERRDETKNFDATQTIEQVRSLVPEVFQNASSNLHFLQLYKFINRISTQNIILEKC